MNYLDKVYGEVDKIRNLKLVENNETFNLMIKNNSQQRRYSGLCDRICELGKE